MVTVTACTSGRILMCPIFGMWEPSSSTNVLRFALRSLHALCMYPVYVPHSPKFQKRLLIGLENRRCQQHGVRLILHRG